MDRNSVKWHGQGTAITTPFDQNGAIDEGSLRAHVDFLIQSGVNFIVANGCTGEFWSQTMEERKRVVKIVVDAAKGRVPVIGGSSANYTLDVIEFARYHKEIGCDGIMVMPPVLVRPSTEDLYQHYKAVSDAVEIPLLMYNIPRDTVNDLTPDLINRLADLRTVVGIKDSTFDFNIFMRLQSMAGDRIRIIIGPSTMFGMAALLHGAEGWIDTYSNLWPQLTVELYRATKAGDLDRARELQARAADFRRYISSGDRNMYCVVKAAMNMQGLKGGGYPRLPLRPLQAEADLAFIRQGIERFAIPRAEAFGIAAE